jgi:uncharacterized protein YciI
MLFAMIRKGGPAWDPSLPLREQDDWNEHARFMDALFDQGFLVMAGPLGDGTPEHRVLLIFDADSESAIDARLAEDIWTQTGTLSAVSLEPWNVLIGDLSAR